MALDLNTGKLRWNYQFTHHDLWDMDVGSQPTLLDLKTADGVKPALIAPTKQGSLYVLDRRDGTPIVPIREVPAPQGAVEGDHTAPTQARSDLNLLRPPLTERDMWGSSPFDQMLCRIQFRSLRYEGQYTPPSEQGSLIYPGQRRGVQLGRGVGRPGAPDPLHQPQLHGLRLADGAARQGAQRKQARGRDQRRAAEHRRALRGDHASVHVAHRPAVPGAVLGVTWRVST
ncbi:glucose dehydrogenase [Pseudomonas aeruginosa]|nr:glucose dehydrogenase [Pseudomonas aeruginosa]